VPTFWSLASMSRIYSRVGNAKTGTSSRQPLRQLNTFYSTGDHCDITTFAVSRFNGCAILQSLVCIACNILPVPGMPGVRSNPGGNPVFYSPYFLRVSCQAVVADDVFQVLNLRCNRAYLEGYSLRPAPLSRSKTSRRRLTCVLKSGEITMMSLR